MSQIDIPNAKTSFFIFQADLLNFWNYINIHLEIRFSKHSWVELFEFWDWGYFIFSEEWPWFFQAVNLAELKLQFLSFFDSGLLLVLFVLNYFGV